MLPNVLLAGTVLPASLAGLARFFYSRGPALDLERHIQTFDFAMVGLVILVWTVVFPIAIGCVIVWLMKGPAYVADGLRSLPQRQAHV